MKIFFLLVTCSLFAQLNIEVNARSAILMNAKTGAILYEKNAHEKRYPASITKIATTVFSLDHKNPDFEKLVTVSGEALKIKPSKDRELYPSYWNEKDGTVMGLVKGEILPLENLFYGMMRLSGNDAANVIAENLSSSTPDFVAEMNEYLLSLGCKNTHFSNPHGLHHESHYSTAYDMCLITQRALEFPVFRDIVSNSFYQKGQTNKQTKTAIHQKNALVKKGEFYYPRAFGVKTGYHSNASFTLVAAAEHEGRELIAVLLGCDTREGRYQDAIRLFEKAYAETEVTKVYFTKGQVFNYSMDGAKTALNACLDKEIAFDFFPAEEPTCRAFVHWELPSLPIQKGQKVGIVKITDRCGKVLKTANLLAEKEVKPTFNYWVKSFFK